MVQRVAGLFLHNGFCVVSDAGACCCQHLEVVGAVPDGYDLFGLQAQLCCQRVEKIGLGLRINNMPEDVAGELAVDDFQRIRSRVVKPGHGLYALGKEIEAAGNQQGFDAMLFASSDPFQCPRVELQPLINDALQCAFIKTAQ